VGEHFFGILELIINYPWGSRRLWCKLYKYCRREWHGLVCI